jgi:outer membrane receptor for ferrienterochelin and colicin
MKRFGLVLALLAVVVMAGSAVAQEQTGSLVGKITADGGESLPGVSVEIKGSAGTLVAVTDAKGEYRFPRVSPGAYKVTARLQGFQTYEASRVNVSLGDKATVNVTLKISSVMETVVVTGERVQIAVGENSTSTTIASEQIALLPKGRDFTTVVTQAPGVSNEAFLGGISIDGASGAENRFVIDGVDTTHPQDGVSGQNFVTDFLEEVQVKSAGYAAEYGGSLGGVINAITKSGTNEFHGWAGAYYSNSAMNGDQRPTYGQSYPNYYKTFEKDDLSQIEPGFGLGGPIAKDSLWFYAGYNPTISNFDRTPEGSSTSYARDITTNYFTANLKANLGSKLLLKLAANGTLRKDDGVLPAQDGSTPPEANLAVTTKTPTSSYSLYADYVPTSNLYLTGRVGYWNTDVQTTGLGQASQVFFRSGIIPVPTTDPLYRPTGFRSTPTASFNGTDQDEWKRQSAGLDLNLFATALGSHSIKVGVQYEKIKNAVSSGEVGNQYEIRWGLSDRYGMGVKGTYGSVAVRRFRTEGAAESTNVGLFIQDTWTIVPNFTLNIGVRTEQERVPNYGFATDPTLPENAIEFDFKDKLAPRLGFSWDVTGKGTAKVYGSYGNYFDITKLEMPRGSFGADHWVTHVYPLETTNWQTAFSGCAISQNNTTQNPCPQLGAVKNRDLRLPTDPRHAIDPDLQPMENREFQLGVEYQVSKNSVVSARYVNKKLINTIEDIGYLSEDGTGEVYITGNPGKGIVACTPTSASPCPEFPQAEAIRDYEAIELIFNRRFADNFSFRAAYTYSKLTGNYSGLASSDEFGRTDPNVARYFDGLVYGYDSQNRIVDGVLNTDRPHAFEVSGAYRMPWAMTAGLNFSYFSGSPVSTDGSFNGVNFFPNGRNDLGRLDALTNLDLYIAQPFQIGRMQLEVSLNVLNLLDSDTVTRIGNVKYFDDVCDVRADCDGTNDWYFKTLGKYSYDGIMKAGHAEEDPSYRLPLAWQAPRTVRFAVKLSF